MLAVLIILQALTALLVLWLLLRRSGVSATANPKLQQLLSADLPGQLARLDARTEALERLVRAELNQLRQETALAASQGRDAASKHSEGVRRELLTGLQALSGLLRTEIEGFQHNVRSDAERLRSVVDTKLNGVERRLAEFTADAGKHRHESQESLHARLTELTRAQSEHQERLRNTVEVRLERLNEANAAKLDEMRATVDEKLHATLQTRLTESFGAVTDQLTKVHSGLGEMSKLSAGVDDLSRIFTNVKSRGGFAEVQLGILLNQMLAPSQYLQNAKVKPNTAEMVEFAVKLPTPQGDVLLPIDAKFPREAWERLEGAYAGGTPPEIATAGKAFENAIRTEGKRICEKYIAPPATTNFAIMFLPTEGLYAEVMRRDGLQSDVQQNCRVTIAGPSTLSAILNSFQMGFHMLQMQQKGDEVWKVLASARTQFEKYEGLMTKMDDQVSRVQRTIQEVGTRTRAINRTLKDVSTNEPDPLPNNGSGHEGAGTEDFMLTSSVVKQ